MTIRFFQFVLFLVVSLFGLAGCQATDVGNPLPTTIITQPLTGQLDLVTLDAALAGSVSALVTKDSTPDSNTKAIDTTLLLVVATEVNDELGAEAAVDVSGIFTIEVVVGYSYYFDVTYDGTVVGTFRFKQDVSGSEGNELALDSEIGEIDMGCIGFSDDTDEFSPQNEPFDAYEEHEQEEQANAGTQTGGLGSGAYSGEDGEDDGGSEAGDRSSCD